MSPTGRVGSLAGTHLVTHAVGGLSRYNSSATYIGRIEGFTPLVSSSDPDAVEKQRVQSWQ